MNREPLIPTSATLPSDTLLVPGKETRPLLTLSSFSELVGTRLPSLMSQGESLSGTSTSRWGSGNKSAPWTKEASITYTAKTGSLLGPTPETQTLK